MGVWQTLPPRTFNLAAHLGESWSDLHAQDSSSWASAATAPSASAFVVTRLTSGTVASFTAWQWDSRGPSPLPAQVECRAVSMDMRNVRDVVMAVNDSWAPAPPPGFRLEWEAPHCDPAGPVHVVGTVSAGVSTNFPINLDEAAGATEWRVGYATGWQDVVQNGGGIGAAHPLIAAVPENFGPGGWNPSPIAPIQQLGGFTAVASGLIDLDGLPPGTFSGSAPVTMDLSTAVELALVDWLTVFTWDEYLQSGSGPPWFGIVTKNYGVDLATTAVTMLGQPPRYRYMPTRVVPPMHLAGRAGVLDGHASVAGVDTATKQGLLLQRGML